MSGWGIGIEQLTYKEQLSEFAVTSSGKDMRNLVLYLEAHKRLQNLFIGARGLIPLASGEIREHWSQNSELARDNSLSYR